MKRLTLLVLALCFATSSHAQDPRKSGFEFLSKNLQTMQLDASQNPATLWVERGQTLFQTQCVSCHGSLDKMKSAATIFPKLNADNKLINLEDQILKCAQRGKTDTSLTLESEPVLTLSAALHQAAKGLALHVTPDVVDHYEAGRSLYNKRMGRINLACVHCHDQKVGAQMRGDTISQGHPTGFPIYRMSWQTVGSIDRRLRACYSGVQAPLPPAGALELRQLELFLKVRANDMSLDGPSIRR